MTDTLKPIDPTLNVKELVDLQIKRQDDIRENEIKRLEDKIGNNDDKYKIEFNAAKEAVTKAEVSTDKRFDAVSEVTKALETNQAKLVTRIEYASAHQGIIDKVDGVVDRLNRTEGASGIYVTQADLNSAIDRLQGSIEATLKPVVAFMNSVQGQQRGISASWGVALGLVGFIATLMTIFLAVSGHIK